jgi:hypothetical protein
MNASTNSAIRARNPQFVTSRVPRIIAGIAAVVVTLLLFEGVTLLGEPAADPAVIEASATAVAQATAPVEAR